MMEVIIKSGGILMKLSNMNQDDNLSKEQETYKGTLFSVSVVGAVIFITYLIIYGLYMARL